MLREKIYPKIEPFVNQIAEKLDRLSISPNQITLTGLVLAFMTGWIYASGHTFFAGIFLAASASCDLLDAALARLTKKNTGAGDFLDATMNCYADFFIFGGLALFFARVQSLEFFLISLGTLLGIYISDYVQARSTRLLRDVKIGFFERMDRVAILILGSILLPLFFICMIVLLIESNLTAIQRILYVHKELKKSE